MDGSRFDTWTRRRVGRATGGLATALLGLGLLVGQRAPLPAKSRKKKGKRRRLPFNAFGCLNVGRKCRGRDGLCCSGICAGKKPKPGRKDRRRCVAHDTGGCTVTGLPCTMPAPACTTSLGEGGGCVTTTGNAPYCMRVATTAPCTKDADCVPTFGSLAACRNCAGKGQCASLVFGPD
jgi:hypothetical protein